MVIEIFELLTSFSSVADGLAAIFYSGLRLFGMSEEKAKKTSQGLVIILFGLTLIAAIYAIYKYS